MASEFKLSEVLLIQIFSTKVKASRKPKMNSCLLLKFFAASILMLSAKAESSTEVSSADFEELMNLTVNECKIKENASDEDVLSATTIIGDWPQTREGKCFIDCFLEEIGIVSARKLSHFSLLKKNFFSSFKTTNFPSVDFSILLAWFLMGSKKTAVIISRNSMIFL